MQIILLPFNGMDLCFPVVLTQTTATEWQRHIYSIHLTYNHFLVSF